MFNFIAVLALPATMATVSLRPVTTPAVVDSADMTLVVVQNDRKVPVTVYVQNEFGEHKLGVVGPYDEVTMRLDDYVFGREDIQFFVRPVGQSEESTEPIDVERSDRIGLIIPQR